MSSVSKVRRGRAFYEKLLARREREGTSWKELSEESGVPIATLYDWSRRFRKERESSGGRGRRDSGFVNVVADDVADPPRVEIRLSSGRVLWVDLASDLNALGQLITMLESC